MVATRPQDRWLIDEVLPHERRYLAAARRFTRGSEEAADLVQEALVRLVALDGWAAIADPRAYVLRSIHNIALERIRRAKVVDFQQLTEMDTLDLSDDAPDAFRVVAGRDQMARLGKAIELLPERCRTVFVRRRFRDQPPGEIARDLGISLSTLEKRLARALYLLTRALEPGDSGPPDLDDQAGDGDSRAVG
jgi:RNA polymerase sigma factor (sigma-70 family)